MAENVAFESGKPTYAASAILEAGTICILNSAGKLAKAAANSTGGIFITLTAAKADEAVAVALAGASSGAHVVAAAAGTYAPGVVVYAAANGTVSVAGTRVVGYHVGNASVTLAAAGKITVAPVYA